MAETLQDGQTEGRDRGQKAHRSTSRPGLEPIAIIGMACRFPGGVTTPEDYWDLLAGGRDAISDIPPERWNVDALYDANGAARGKMNTRRGGFLLEPSITLFDPSFFGITEQEALAMDPQQRILLELAWEAIERAGYAPNRLRGSQTGVYVGMMNNDFGALRQNALDEIDIWFGTGNAASAASGRISYLLGLQGPSLTLDTACSSSLVAVHLACQSLRGGETDLALAGGVTLLLSPAMHIYFSKVDGLAPDGRAKVFDASADGTVWSEGGGIVVLKRLSDALEAGDPILATISGTAVNQDGRSNGLTAPNGPAQQAVIRRALKQAGLDPAVVGYVETHGTGTALGDPIEIQALDAVLSEGRPVDRPLWLGAVKSNLGHTMASAGMAGLMKAVLVLQHGEIPANLHFKRPSPHIPWDRIKVRVPTTLTPWPASDLPRIAGVSAFGISGTNAHIVVEEALRQATDSANLEPSCQVLALSGRTSAALAAQAGRFARFVRARPDVPLSDICYTANTARIHFDHRLALPAEEREALAAALEGFERDGLLLHGAATGVVPMESPRPLVGFVFPGLGVHFAQMGRALFELPGPFRSTLESCDEVLRTLGLSSLAAGLYGEGSLSWLEQPEHASVALVAVEYALAQFWAALGVVPDVLLGIGVGEYAAACVAGVLELSEALRLAITRARLLSQLPDNNEVVEVGASSRQVQAVVSQFGNAIVTAGSLAPDRTLIAGRRFTIRQACAAFQAERTPVRRLPVFRPTHTRLVEGAREALEEAFHQSGLRLPRVPFVSSTTGQETNALLVGPSYWGQQLVAPLRVVEGLETAKKRGCQVLLEVGPRLLSPEHGQVSGAGETRGTTAPLPSLDPARPGWAPVLEALARLHVRGAPIDWATLGRQTGARRVAVPTYPFQRDVYWRDIPVEGGVRSWAPTAFTGAVSLTGLSLFVPRWVPQERETDLESVTNSEPSQWLLLGNDARQLHALQTRLEALGQEVSVHLLSSEEPSLSAATLDCLVNEAAASEWPWRGVVWAFTDPEVPSPAAPPEAPTVTTAEWPPSAAEESSSAPAGEPTPDRALDVLQESSGGLVALAQALLRAELKTLPRLFILTRGVQPCGPDAPVLSASVALWGMGRTLANEHPALRCVRLDLAPVPLPNEEDAVALELLDQANNEDEIAFRTGGRFVARLERWYPPDRSTTPDRQTTLEHPGGSVSFARGSTPVTGGSTSIAGGSISIDGEGTYLVTGGLGALGLDAARWLVTRGARHLVLVSRRGAADPAAQAAISSLETHGARVTLARADVSREDECARVLEGIRKEGPALKGLVHAAGLVDDGLFARLTPAQIAAVFSGKALGAWHLHRLTRQDPLDFFILYSSAVSLLGAPGQGNYAGANAFLDTLAHHRRAMGLPAISINWGAFEDVGMMAGKAERAMTMARRGIRGLSLAQGRAVLEAILNAPLPEPGTPNAPPPELGTPNAPSPEPGKLHVPPPGSGTLNMPPPRPGTPSASPPELGVLSVELSRLAEAFPGAASSPRLSALTGVSSAGARADSGDLAFRAALERLPASERRSRIEALIREQVARILQVDEKKLPLEADLTTLGMDSLTGLELKQRIEALVGLQLPHTVLLGEVSIKNLARALFERIGDV